MPDQNTEVIIARLNSLSGDVSELKDALREIANAITRLALVEERQTQTNGAMARAFNQLDKIETRVSAIEKELPTYRQSSSWVTAAVWATAGAAIVFVAKKVGLL